MKRTGAPSPTWSLQPHSELLKTTFSSSTAEWHYRGSPSGSALIGPNYYQVRESRKNKFTLAIQKNKLAKL